LASSSGDGGGSDLYVGSRLAVWLSLISAALSRTSGTIVAMNMAGRKRRRRRMRVTTTTTREGIFEGGKIATRRRFRIGDDDNDRCKVTQIAWGSGEEGGDSTFP